MKQVTKLGVLCLLLFSGSSLYGAHGATLKKVVSPKAQNRLVEAQASEPHPEYNNQVLAQAGCVIKRPDHSLS